MYLYDQSDLKKFVIDKIQFYRQNAILCSTLKKTVFEYILLILKIYNILNMNYRFSVLAVYNRTRPKSMHFYVKQFAVIVKLSCLHRQMRVFVRNAEKLPTQSFFLAKGKICHKIAFKARRLSSREHSSSRRSSSSHRLNADNSRTEEKSCAYIRPANAQQYQNFINDATSELGPRYRGACVVCSGDRGKV